MTVFVAFRERSFSIVLNSVLFPPSSLSIYTDCLGSGLICRKEASFFMRCFSGVRPGDLVKDPLRVLAGL
jgi:hypothetical protein